MQCSAACTACHVRGMRTAALLFVEQPLPCCQSNPLPTKHVNRSSPPVLCLLLKCRAAAGRPAWSSVPWSTRQAQEEQVPPWQA